MLTNYNLIQASIKNQSIFEFVDEKSTHHIKEILRACHQMRGNFDSVQFDCNFRKKNSFECFKIAGFYKRKLDSSGLFISAKNASIRRF